MVTLEELTLVASGDAFITCGACRKPASVDRWVTSRLGLTLPRGTYQCPHCRHAFRRQAAVDELGRSVIRYVEVGGVL